MHSLSRSWFVKISSKHHKSQTLRARELEFWENVHPLQHVTCNMSHVMFHMSHVMYPMPWVKFIFSMWWSILVEGLLSTRPTPSSFPGSIIFFLVWKQLIDRDPSSGNIDRDPSSGEQKFKMRGLYWPPNKGNGHINILIYLPFNSLF